MTKVCHAFKISNMKSILKTRFFGILIGSLVGLFLTSVAALGAETKPVLTLSVSSYKDLFDGSKKIAELIGFADEFGKIESTFSKLPGTDNTKSIGLMLFTDEEQFFPVVFLPVGDLDKLKAQFPPVDELISDNLQSVSKGKYKIAGTEYIVEQKKDWLVLYQESQKNILPLDPTTLLGGLNKKNHFTFRVDFENTPEELVLQAIAPFEFIATMMNPDAGEQIATLKEQMHVILEQGKWFSYGFSIDSKSGNVTGDSEMALKPDSSMGKSVAYCEKGKTDRIGFYQPNQALAVHGYGVVAEDQRESNVTAVKNYISSLRDGLEYEIDEDELEVATEIVDAIEEIIVATIKDGKTDWGLSFLTSGDIIFSTYIAKGDQLGDVLKKAATKIGEIDPDLKDLMKIEYTSFEGFRFSRIAVPLNILPQADAMPGPLQEKTVYILLGINANGVCGVVGTDESRLETVLKKGITDSKNPVDVPKKIVQFSLPLTAKAVKATGLTPKEPEFEAVLNTLEKAPDSAVLHVTQTITTSSQTVTAHDKFFLDGSVFASVAKAVRAAQNAQDQAALDSNPFEKDKASKKQSDNRVRDFEF